MKPSYRIGLVVFCILIAAAVSPTLIGGSAVGAVSAALDAPPALALQSDLATVEPFHPTPTATPALLSITPPSTLTSNSPDISPALATRSTISPTHALTRFDLFLYVPPARATPETLRVLVVLHGMWGQGKAFAQPLVAAAERNHWLLVAPTIPYSQDYMNPELVMQEDLRLGADLHALLEELPARTGRLVRPRALILGFSRGAQLAHRFAFFHPEQVAAVAAISAGSYTMPLAKRNNETLDFPFGVGDLAQRLGEQVNWDGFRKVSFWIAVGGKDNQASDVPRAFDPYCGRTRVERAKAFELALREMGINARLAIFPDAGHEVSPDMREAALQFLQQTLVADLRSQ